LPLKKICIIVLLIHIISSTSQVAAPAWVKNVGAKTFPSSKKIFLANDFGAKKDTTFISTKAIQSAIDKCASGGGGVVKFLPGVYVTGSLFIKSNVELRNR
jgi:polygalacturonase